MPKQKEIELRLPAQLQDIIQKFTDYKTPDWEKENLLRTLMDIRDATCAILDGYEKAQKAKRK